MRDPHLVTGLRPTGPLHIGHYVGALRPLVELQQRYTCFVMVADWHALISTYREPHLLPGRSLDLAVDFLAAGVDPDRCHLFVQSDVPEHLEFQFILGTLAGVGALERTPHYKEKLAQGHDASYALLGYPVLQAADVLLYRAAAVPVGQDQSAHLEHARELARRLNRLYGLDFPEPATALGATPRLVGTDGEKKMSKSLGNVIELRHSPDETAARIRTMPTDPQRTHRHRPGRPEVCPVFSYYQAFTPPDVCAATAGECRSAARGCVECKLELAGRLNARLAPLRERRRDLLAHPEPVLGALARGTEAARTGAAANMQAVRQAMGLPAPRPAPRRRAPRAAASPGTTAPVRPAPIPDTGAPPPH